MSAPLELFHLGLRLRNLSSGSTIVFGVNKIFSPILYSLGPFYQRSNVLWRSNLIRTYSRTPFAHNTHVEKCYVTWVKYPSSSDKKQCNFNQTCRNATHCAEKKCWKCGRRTRETEMFFCECGVVQSVADVNYFQLMGIEQSFDIDTVLLSTKLKDLQKLLHPDKYTLKSEKEKMLSEQQSSTVNKAYATLFRPLSRALYLLELHGQPLEEDNSDVNQAFLMDIMEINEQLAEIHSVDKMKPFEKENNTKLDECFKLLSQAFNKRDIKEAKQHVIKLKYFSNIDDKIKDFYQKNV